MSPVVYRKTLVPLDGSEVALPYAHLIAQRYGGELILLTICAPKCDDRLKRLCKAYLDPKVVELKSQEIRMSSAVIYGNIAEKIVDFSIKNQIDLIVIASHGYSGFKQLTLGSVA